MTRRSFWATLAAPFLARFAPKAKPIKPQSIFDLVNAKFIDAQRRMSEMLAGEMYRGGWEGAPPHQYLVANDGVYELWPSPLKISFKLSCPPGGYFQENA